MSLEQMLERFHLASTEILDWQVHFNVAPTLEIPVLVNLTGAGLQLVRMKWGLRPPWAKDAKYQPIINLRTETLLTKPGFKHMLEHTRCLVPVDGFNEWKTENKKKFPYRFVMKSGEIFCLGGVFTTAEQSQGNTLFTVSLITTEANSVVGPVHARMPVILPRSQESVWLDPKSKLSDFAAVLSPYPAQEMRSYPVSTKINSGRINTPDLIAPLEAGA